MAKKGGLGKGLDALFSEAQFDAAGAQEKAGNIITLRLSDIEPDKNQPRKTFEPEALSSLADSISTHGVLQPLVVRKPEGVADDADAVSKILGSKYRIVAGERRWRAAKMAGLTEVPVIIKEMTDHEAAAIMLVENLQREDLNSVEQARGLKRLLEEFELTQEETAQIVGISRPALTNSLRLLALPEKTLSLLEHGELSAGHARALLSIGNAKEINNAAETVVAKGLSVRETERLAKLIYAQLNSPKTKKKETSVDKSAAAYIGKLEENMSAKLGRKAKIVMSKKGEKGGKLELEYYDNTDLEKLIGALCGDVFEDLK
ncbi:MAG: ParB/RepB/Spo0J family partition protein [Ruminococcaceae bacterium]|nr:ParB/RepB/Spo0J family partition protein [Oscillospiraceae bacterium]